MNVEAIRVFRSFQDLLHSRFLCEGVVLGHHCDHFHIGLAIQGQGLASPL